MSTTRAGSIVFWMWATTADDAEWLYQGGLAVTADLVALIIAGVISDRPSPLGRVLSLRPVWWIGVISYGLYLWHWLVYVALTSRRTGLDGPALLALRLACTLVISTASYYLVEAPNRRGALRGWRIPALTPAAALGVIAAFVAVTASISAPRSRARDRRRQAWHGTCAHPTGVGAAAPGIARGVLIGDSVALTLGLGFERVEPPTLWMKNASVLGCGVIRGEASIGGRWYPNAANCDGWSSSWVELIQREHARVVVGFWRAWDMYDRRVAGEVMRWGTPELDRFLTSELDHAVTVLASTGAGVVLITPAVLRPTRPRLQGSTVTRACSSATASTIGTSSCAALRTRTRTR